MQIGRAEIYTDEAVVTADNVIKILQNAIPKHVSNAERCNFLLEYEAGNQRKTRVKKYRSDIDNWCVDNLANEITDFKLSYNWGNPVTMIQRGEKDSGNENEAQAIALLNECYEAERIKKKTQELARFVEICGIGYTIVGINTEWVGGDSYFTLNVLDPRNAFVIRSSYYLDRRPILGVTYRSDSQGNRFFTCFSKDMRFEIKNMYEITNGKEKRKETWGHMQRSGEENPLKMIPIVEWIRSCDRMGCFERQVPELDNLNLLVSDFTNGVEQNIQCLWLWTDIELPKDEKGNEVSPRSNDAVRVFTSQDGKTPNIKPLVMEQDYTGMINQMAYRVNRIKEKCNVPQRNDNSGGSTGIAMSDATGWTNAEIEASKQDQIKESCKEDEIRVVLAAIKECPYTPADSPLLNLRHSDVKPSIKRQKNYEMTTKINAFATGVSHGIAPEWMIPTINLFDDPQQVILDSKEYMERYLKSAFNENSVKQEQTASEQKPNTDRLSGDESDQIGNSPNIDGMRMEQGG